MPEANLALALILHEQQAQRTIPGYAVLFYGVYDTDFDTPSYRKFAEGPGLTRSKMQRYLNWYIGSSQPSNPLISINRTSDELLSALPPLYLCAAEIDPLCSDTENLHARLQALGRQDILYIVPGVVHGFLQMTLKLRAARDATTHAAKAFCQMAEHFHNNQVDQTSTLQTSRSQKELSNGGNYQ